MIRRSTSFCAAMVLFLGSTVLGMASTTSSQPLVAPTTPAGPTTPAMPATPLVPNPDGPAFDNSDGPNPFGKAPKLADPKIDTTMPVVHYGEEGLPDKVKALRQHILAATRTGDIEALRPIITDNGSVPELPGDDPNADPIASLKLLAGDDKGREILAILEEVLEAGYVHVDVGTPDEMYIWPYFARMPLDKLTGPQMVELFRLITAGDYQDMQDKNVYSFFRAGITPDGKWNYLEDGD